MPVSLCDVHACVCYKTQSSFRVLFLKAKLSVQLGAHYVDAEPGYNALTVNRLEEKIEDS